MKVKVFVAYCHNDGEYLDDNSLLGHLRGLERDNHAEFWFDERIAAGEIWDDEIKDKIQQSHIALVLVSELFLTSAYVRRTEIPLFLKKRREDGMIIFPVILSACDWNEHEWLSETQFLPRDDKTIEEHFCDAGPRKKLFLQIKRDLMRHISRIEGGDSGNGFSTVVAGRTQQETTMPREDEEEDTEGEGQEVQHREWQNPFDLVAANELDYDEIPPLFVGEYTNFNTINKHFDTIVEGQRGTGKTMILRYLAFETQMKIWVDDAERNPMQFFEEKSNHMGVYCRLEQGVFDRSDLDAVHDEDRKTRLFEHRLCLFCLSHLLSTLKSIFQYRPAQANELRSMRNRLANLLMEEGIKDCTNWTEVCFFANETISSLVAEEDLHLGSILPGGTPTQFNPWLTLSGQFLPLLEFLREILNIACPFFVMFDDFDVLRPSQQAVVFGTASARNLQVVCFKYGIMTLGKKEMMSGTERTYREGDDYDFVSLDWIDKGLRSDYHKAVELITEKRLISKNWPKGLVFKRIVSTWEHGVRLRERVQELAKTEYDSLPDKNRPKTFTNFWSKYGNARYFQYLAKKKIHHTYAGYDAIIDISSGIYRQYLEICGRIVAKALASGWRPNTNDKIEATVQDDAIREYSGAMKKSLSVTAGDTSFLLSGDLAVTSKQMVKLIESLCALFKKRLHSQSREPEIFSISIKDSIQENPNAKAILDVAVRESIMQRRKEDYPPKTSGGPALPTFMLNRRLAPHQGLGVRMQGRIEIRASDVVLAATDTDTFVKKFLKDSDEGDTLWSRAQEEG